MTIQEKTHHRGVNHLHIVDVRQPAMNVDAHTFDGISPKVSHQLSSTFHECQYGPCGGANSRILVSQKWLQKLDVEN